MVDGLRGSVLPCPIELTSNCTKAAQSFGDGSERVSCDDNTVMGWPCAEITRRPARYRRPRPGWRSDLFGCEENGRALKTIMENSYKNSSDLMLANSINALAANTLNALIESSLTIRELGV